VALGNIVAPREEEKHGGNTFREGGVFMMQPIERSVLPWLGGKHYSVKRIIACFPDAGRYDVYAEPFVGAANVLLGKPRRGHIEAMNDRDDDLMNFWWCIKFHYEEMRACLGGLPYSHFLHTVFHRSLFDGTQLERVERACRWFYVLRCNFHPLVGMRRHGWLAGKRDYPAELRSAVELFEQVAARLVDVRIESLDFEPFIRLYESVRTFIYCDPPYIGTERYYRRGQEDYRAFHERLARVLNATPSLVALSYSPAPQLDVLYPVSKWRRVEWQRPNHMQRQLTRQERVRELLLCNYGQGDLWGALQGDSLALRPGDVCW
jgi:DNA adenine methylase